jgi:hypothetical protein
MKRIATKKKEYSFSEKGSIEKGRIITTTIIPPSGLATTKVAVCPGFWGECGPATQNPSKSCNPTTPPPQKKNTHNLENIKKRFCGLTGSDPKPWGWSLDKASG